MVSRADISSLKLSPYCDAGRCLVFTHQNLPGCEDSNKLDEEETPQLVAAEHSDPLSDVVWLLGPHPCHPAGSVPVNCFVCDG